MTMSERQIVNQTIDKEAMQFASKVPQVFSII